MSELTIREMAQDDDFAEWLSDILQREERAGEALHLDDRYLVLSNEIGDWVGGLRYAYRGGVATLLELAVTPPERHRGYAHLLLAAFEERARESGGHLAEFWTDDARSEGLLAAFGWRRVLQRPGYFGRRTWTLMEKPLESAGE